MTLWRILIVVLMSVSGYLLYHSPFNAEGFVKWLIGIFDPSFLSIVFIFLTLGWFLWCQDREDKTNFKVVNFFKTNGHEDISKLIMLIVTLCLCWTLALQVKEESLDIYMLLAYMAYGLGSPVFYAMLRTITNILGKPEIVKQAMEIERASINPRPADQPAPTGTDTTTTTATTTTTTTGTGGENVRLK